MNVYSLCRYLTFASLATTILFCFAAVARGQGIDTWQVLHDNPRCDHVIQQVMRHGVNQSVDRCDAADDTNALRMAVERLGIPEAETTSTQL